MKWLVLALVIGLFVWIVAGSIKRKHTGCSCGCSQCGMKDICHKKGKD